MDNRELINKVIETVLGIIMDGDVDVFDGSYTQILREIRSLVYRELEV